MSHIFIILTLSQRSFVTKDSLLCDNNLIKIRFIVAILFSKYLYENNIYNKMVSTTRKPMIKPTELPSKFLKCLSLRFLKQYFDFWRQKSLNVVFTIFNSFHQAAQVYSAKVTYSDLNRTGAEIFIKSVWNLSFLGSSLDYKHIQSNFHLILLFNSIHL